MICLASDTAVLVKLAFPCQKQRLLIQDSCHLFNGNSTGLRRNLCWSLWITLASIIFCWKANLQRLILNGLLVLQSDFQLKLVGKKLHGSQLELPLGDTNTSALETISS